MLKDRPNEKVEAALDQALADTFPASDPVAVLQPTSAGLGENPARETQAPADLTSPRKDSIPRAAA